MNLWPKVPSKVHVHKISNVDIMEDESGEPVLRLSWPASGITIHLSVNQGELIGGVARGARLRYEDFKEGKIK